MTSSNKFYPHPVLGIEDEIIGDYKPKCYVEINSDFVILKIEEILLCQELKKMVETKQAIFLAEVDCSRSMFRMSKKHSDVECELKISSEEFRGNVNVEFYILADKDMPNYKLDSFNKEYEGLSFDIKRGDILAYGGKDNFYVEKKYKELDSAGSIITIGYYNKDEGPVKFDLEQDQISILIPKKYFELYRNTINVDYYDIYNIHLSSIAFPALFHALSVVFKNMEEKGTDMENCEFFKRKWCEQISHEIKNHSELKKLPKTVDYAPAFAQALLDNPLSRTFVTIDNIIENSKK